MISLLVLSLIGEIALNVALHLMKCFYDMTSAFMFTVMISTVNNYFLCFPFPYNRRLNFSKSNDFS